MAAAFHDLTGAPRVPEDPIAQSEIHALTRRTEAVEDRVESLQVQTGGNFAAVIEGQAALRREVRDGFAKLDARFDALEQKMESNQAHMIELLTRLVGQNPDAG
jgi:tetrahydromethanopterin S-methyltransferase subunit G